jgi:hypothetical protein
MFLWGIAAFNITQNLKDNTHPPSMLWMKIQLLSLPFETLAFPCYNQSSNTWIFTNTLTNQNNQQLHIKVLD